jgi:PAS domain S-box-containing protein
VRENLRKSGIDSVGDVPWGTHFCQFYSTKEDLMDILVPYFKAGIENNEFCVWVISEPLEIEDAKESLRKVIPDLDVYIEKGQIEFIPCTCWNLKQNGIDSEENLSNWIKKLNQVPTSGYDGLRFSWNIFSQEKEGCNTLVKCKKQIDSFIDNYLTMALCTCSLDRSSPIEVIDVVTNHHFSLVKKEGKWERIEDYKCRTAQEILFESEKRFRSVFDDNVIAMALIDLDSRIFRVNNALCQMLGFERSEIQGCNILDFIWLDNRNMGAVAYESLTCNGKFLSSVEVQCICKNEQVILCEMSLSPVKDAQGNLIYTIAHIQDITERKEAEKALKEACEILDEKIKERTSELEETYKSLVESERRLTEAQKMAHIGSWDWDLVTNTSYWSDEVYRIIGLPHYIDELTRQKIEIRYAEVLSFIHPSDRVSLNNAIMGALNGKPFENDYRLILVNGIERIVHMHGEVVFDNNHTPIRIRGTLQDITERKKIEKALEKMEETRKKEIHHRIKNNLQVISSLLDLQAEKFNDEQVKEAFKESQNRVISMALIHEELYKGNGTDTLNFSAYLQKLAENLFQTYRLSSKNIRLVTDIERNIFFDIDIAVPLGIIVNELISNSLKHAFNKNEEGEIRIQLCREKKDNRVHESTFNLTISDSGKGIPQNINFESLESLGLKLVKILVEQLNGEIELKKMHGTEFRISFNIVEYVADKKVQTNRNNHICST